MRVTWEDGDARRIVEERWRPAMRRWSPAVATALREVAEALARGRGEASLAILPLGTANDFARAAGIPLEPAAALALLDQTARPIDLGEVNGKLFLNMATGGFGSKVTANTSEDLKKVLGGAAYLLTGLTRFPKCMPPRAVSAPRTSSGKASSSPWASVTGARPAAARTVSASASGRRPAGREHPADAAGHGRYPGHPARRWQRSGKPVRPRAVPWLEVEAAEGLDVNLDGEPLEGRKLRFSVSPGAARAPAGSPLLREPPRGTEGGAD